MEAKKGRLFFQGTVISDKMDKTIVVTVETMKKHPVYKKYIKKTKKYKAHDSENKAKTGDLVIIGETRHLSKDKYFELIKIVKTDV